MSWLRWVIVALITVGATGCSSEKVETLPVPEPEDAPLEIIAPAGDVWAVGPSPETLAVAAGHVGVAVSEPPRLLIMDGATGVIERSVELPATARHVAAGKDPEGEEQFYVVAGDKLVGIPVDGNGVTRAALETRGDSVAIRGDGKPVVTLGERGQATMLDSDGVVAKTVDVGTHAGSVVAMKDSFAVIDSEASTLALYDDAGTQTQKVRAGDGAVDVVAVNDNRLAVLDARGGELLVYSTGPLFLRHRYPLPGGAYGLAYDSSQNTAWVTLTGRNEVVGLLLEEESPKEIGRYPTVRQPNAAAVDAETGAVYVTGTAAGNVQAFVA